MAFNLSNLIVIGISTTALFDLSYENEIFQKHGKEEYIKHQKEHEQDILKPGVGFKLIQALLHLNQVLPERKIEVIIMSKNSTDSIIRIFNSVEHYKLDITRAIMTSGNPLESYLKALNINLFLSTNELDVSLALKEGIPSGLVYNINKTYNEDLSEIRIAFDGDAVLFSNESELIYQQEGLKAFTEHEVNLSQIPLEDGPFKQFLITLSKLQKEDLPIHTALVTSRGAPTHERVIHTLRKWGISIDEVFFLGGVSKAEILKAFKAHIYFDDQMTHLKGTAEYVPSVHIPTIKE